MCSLCVSLGFVESQAGPNTPPHEPRPVRI